MPETQVASVGYMGEAWLHNGTALYELREVKGFDIPSKGEREQVETTHLKTPGWRHSYVSTFYEDSDFNVMLNYRPLSTTDILLADAHSDGDDRAFKIVIPENGVPKSQRLLTVRCLNYAPSELGIDDVMEATATFRVVAIGEVEAYTA
jgi:hypothetical protein